MNGWIASVSILNDAKSCSPVKNMDANDQPENDVLSTSVAKRNNIKVSGQGKRAMVFSHGFGCDQNMWRYVVPAFLEEYKAVVFDHVGSGNSDLTKFDRAKYSTLYGYARDLLEICRALRDTDIILVGHSVSAMIAILSAIEAPNLFDHLILVGPSPSYINDGDYIGGFDKTDIDELLDFLDTNYLGWSSAMAPAIMGNPGRPDLAIELENSFCRTDPDIAKHFARTTFLSDHRSELGKLTTPSLILQCADDVIAPRCVGEYMHRCIAGSTFVQMSATGHCPNLSAPDETIAAIKTYLQVHSHDRKRRE